MQRALPPANSIVGNESGKKGCFFLDCCALIARQIRSRSFGKNKKLSIGAAQFQCVPGEIFDLISAKLDHFFPRRLQTVMDFFPRERIGNHLQAGERKIRTHAEHYVRVIDGPSVAACAFKDNRLVGEIAAEFFDEFAIGAFRKRDVSDAVRMVEDQTSGAFEKTIALFVVGIIYDFSDAIFFRRASMISLRRSRRRAGEYMGYKTIRPSSWVENQLLGNMASGFSGVGVSSKT